ncbi:hypothetical protein ABZ883_04795 [Streptomyces sp. NPDC046977]|uniref:hypothetical protein n=1 Tax=Streptomyces sp. NPDC046977 TaxID=3154703 RepID=UPI003402384A
MTDRAEVPQAYTIRKSGTGSERKTAALLNASAKKAKSARQRAETGLQEIVDSGDAVTFASVARAAGVSANYLRRQQDLALKIVKLRAQQRGQTHSDGRHCFSSAPVDACSYLLEQQANFAVELEELRRLNNDLRGQLESAKAEIEELRRRSRHG